MENNNNDNVNSTNGSTSPYCEDFEDPWVILIGNYTVIVDILPPRDLGL